MSTANSLSEAKRPRSPLAGPYGHPFHPIAVTVPIGAWVCSLVFDVIAQVSDEAEVFAEGAYWLILIGIVGSAAAAMLGLIDLMGIPRGTRAFRIGLTHMALNATVAVLYIVNFVIRAGQGRDEASTAGLILSIIALLLLGASGWLGGMLAYTYGVRVADEITQSEGMRAEGTTDKTHRE
jgi:uncharacterized membrane protein